MGGVEDPGDVEEAPGLPFYRGLALPHDRSHAHSPLPFFLFACLFSLPHRYNQDPNLAGEPSYTDLLLALEKEFQVSQKEVRPWVLCSRRRVSGFILSPALVPVLGNRRGEMGLKRG